jgi:hypothetical protein
MSKRKRDAQASDEPDGAASEPSNAISDYETRLGVNHPVCRVLRRFLDLVYLETRKKVFPTIDLGLALGLLQNAANVDRVRHPNDRSPSKSASLPFRLLTTVVNRYCDVG